MRKYFTLLFFILLVACGSGTDSDTDNYSSEPTLKEICSNEKNIAANACYDSECRSCAGFACLYCWSYCLNRTESTYVSCCSSRGCTQSISGIVDDIYGTGVAGVKLTIDNMLPQYTDTYGHFLFSDTNGGTLTPSKTGLCFSPTSRYYIHNYRDTTDANFTAKITCYSISGKITTTDATPVSAVTVELSGTLTGTTVTNSSGYYEFGNLTSGTYTVTPTYPSITPGYRSITIETSNAINQDFVI